MKQLIVESGTSENYNYRLLQKKQSKEEWAPVEHATITYMSDQP